MLSAKLHPALKLINLDESKLSDSERDDVWKLVSDWTDIFSADDMDVGLTSAVKHRIILENHTPFKQRHRRIPPAMYTEVKQHLRQLLDSGVIRNSRSPWASNIVLVRKADSSLRLCVDFRMLNSRTVKDAYALPRIEEILNSIGGNQFYSVLDMKSGYHQVEIEESDKPFTAFTAGPLGFFEYNRLPFGLSNAPATYQRLMEEYIGDLATGEDRVCHIYLDDILIVSKTFEEHFQQLCTVFSRIKEAGLKLSPKKCSLFRDRVKYVGHIVSEQGIETDPAKIDKIRNWPVPCNARQLRTFTGFAGYYRRFVKNFSKLCRPLTQLLCDHPPGKKKKNFKPPEWKWDKDQQGAFDSLKQYLSSPPILSYPQYDQPFILHTDASLSGLGAVLYQEIDGQEHVISYASRQLNSAESRYPAHKLEFLALKWAVTQKYHDYLYGHKFVVYTDNNPLTYVLGKAKLDATGHRWIAALSAYDFKILYKPGRTNSDADGLSRCPPELYEEIDPEMIRAICNSHQGLPYISSMSTELPPDISRQDEISPRQWRPLQIKDAVIGQFHRAVTNNQKPAVDQVPLGEGRVLLREYHKLIIRRGVLYRTIQINGESVYQLVLPKEFRDMALRGAHCEMGHLGRDKSLGILRQRVYWPNMFSDVDNWIKSCSRCIRRKSSTAIRAPLVSISTTYPLELVCMDFLQLEASKDTTTYL